MRILFNNLKVGSKFVQDGKEYVKANFHLGFSVCRKEIADFTNVTVVVTLLED